MQGTVRNVVDFGAFVDIGVTEDGLVHISKLKKGYVKHPLDVVSSGDIVTVWVEGVDKGKSTYFADDATMIGKMTTKKEGLAMMDEELKELIETCLLDAFGKPSSISLSLIED